MAGIPFIRDFKFDYGTAMEVTPLIRRVVANNPSPFTFKGTGTYIVGHGRVAVIDPGPLLEAHVDALCRELGVSRNTVYRKMKRLDIDTDTQAGDGY